MTAVEGEGVLTGHDLREPVRRISTITPMRDELASVDAFVADLVAQDFAGELEVLVADGGSVDGSVERLRAAAAAASLELEILPNPAGWVSPGLNACIGRATGDLIVRLDCHSRYPADYLRRCAELAERTGAWNVGGRVVPSGETPMERAVACAMVSPFGGIGWTRVGGSEPVEIDTVTFGAFRPAAFRAAGLFDEELVRNQDDELNLRLRQAGGRIVLDPTLSVHYRPRGSLAGVWRQYFEYGFWKARVMLKHRRVATLRSMAPLALVLSIVVLAIGAAVSAGARLLLGAALAVYLGGALLFALRGVRAGGEPWSLAPRVMSVFPAFHFGYGIGMARGWLAAGFGWLRAHGPRRAGNPSGEER
jgi:glycosyltransferase involved in cell wall biosynthesis